MILHAASLSVVDGEAEIKMYTVVRRALQDEEIDKKTSGRDYVIPNPFGGTLLNTVSISE